MFGLFKKKDPVCGMPEEKGEGISKYGKWFCNTNCLKKYEKWRNKSQKSCCH